MKPTKETYSAFDQAYDHFNKRLFGGSLPPCIITLHRRKGAYGYFWGETWKQRGGKAKTDEIAMNPDTFRDRELKDLLSTLAHEMCHLQQHHVGKPSRNGYHNKEWAQMMENVGLIPTDTGQPGGKKTGQRVTHYIEAGGLFDTECDKLLAKGFTIPWQALTGDEETKKKKTASKTKYSCPDCDLNAWAKPDVVLVCGECDVELEAED